MIADTEVAMNAVERTQHYTELPTEPQTVGPAAPGEKARPADNAIEFVEYSMRYREGLPLVLSEVSCKIESNESIGIVGRTGSGKSSLAAALLRLVPAASGEIRLGGVNVESIPLTELRAMTAFVPQDPVMFSGSLRASRDRGLLMISARLTYEGGRCFSFLLQAPTSTPPPCTATAGSRRRCVASRWAARRDEISEMSPPR